MSTVRYGFVFVLSCLVLAGADAQEVEQSRGIDQRVDYPALARFGEWDDRNYNLRPEDLTWLAPNEEELHPGIPVFFRVELRKEWPHLQRSGPAQYPRASNKLFEIRYGGYMRNGAIYLTRRDVLMDGNSIWGDSICPFVMPPERSVGVDTEYDFQLVCQMMEEKQNAPRDGT